MNFGGGILLLQQMKKGMKELLSAFRRGMNIAGPSDAAGKFDLTTSIEMPDTPLSRRRMEHLIAGGLVRKLKRNQFDDPTPVIDLRHIDDRNCFELPKKRVRSSSPESMSSQLKIDCGYDERRRSSTAVRLNQCGIFFYRAEVEKENPDAWFSWMKEDDERHRPKEEYAVISTGPSLRPPFNPPHPPIVPP